MRDLWNLFRGGLPRLDELSYSFEKAGQVFDNQPIPWCAEGVVVHAALALPQQTPGKSDFTLRLDGQSLATESFHTDDGDATIRMTFRFPVPAQTGLADLCWRNRSLGQLALPVQTADDFARKLVLQMPTVSVRVGDQTVACQTYVNTQCQGLVVSAILSSPSSLAPILDLGLRVEIRHAEGGLAGQTGVCLSGSQLKSRQALVSVVLPKPKRIGTWEIVWLLGERPLSTQSIKAISRQQFLRSLRLASTRFVIQNDNGAIHVERFLGDLDGIARLGPCFLISSGETGMAGLCILQVCAQVKGAVQPPLLQEQEVLITDGPFPFVPGTLDVADLAQVKNFELRCGRDILGTLSITPVPSATFTKEGGFLPPDAFEWSPAAEEQLKERLGKLLG